MACGPLRGDSEEAHSEPRPIVPLCDLKLQGSCYGPLLWALFDSGGVCSMGRYLLYMIFIWYALGPDSGSLLRADGPDCREASDLLLTLECTLGLVNNLGLFRPFDYLFLYHIVV